MSTTRIRGLHDAAVRLFLRQGYAQTQISHIARDIPTGRAKAVCLDNLLTAYGRG